MKCVDRVWIVLGFLFCSLGSAGGSLRLAEDNIDEIVKQMSPREKAMLLVGCESLVSKDSLTVYVPGAAGDTGGILGLYRAGRRSLRRVIPREQGQIFEVIADLIVLGAHEGSS